MTTHSTAKTKILVWDAPTRVFHWLLALCFVGAYITSEGDRLMGVHLTLGYTTIGLVAFRLVWGLIGTRHARFTSFIRGPKALARYANGMVDGRDEHHVGHNPLGAVSIVMMLLSIMAIACTGWVYFNGGAHSVKELHEGAAAFMLTLVMVHVAGVMFASMKQRENLVRAMLTGHKKGQVHEGIRWSWWPVALMVLAAVLGFWWLQWQSPPANMPQENGHESQRFDNGIARKSWNGDHDD